MTKSRQASWAKAEKWDTWSKQKRNLSLSCMKSHTKASLMAPIYLETCCETKVNQALLMCPPYHIKNITSPSQLAVLSRYCFLPWGKYFHLKLIGLPRDRVTLICRGSTSFGVWLINWCLFALLSCSITCCYFWRIAVWPHGHASVHLATL